VGAGGEGTIRRCGAGISYIPEISPSSNSVGKHFYE
jgi:hypothetical protein